MARDRRPAIRTVATPADASADGDILCGSIMSQTDMAAGALAARIARGRGAPVAVDAMTSQRSVTVGDAATIHAARLPIGRSSIRRQAQAERRERPSAPRGQATAAGFAVVAIDDEGRPRSVRAED